jgi:putative solute:sodium symporter small subunit
MATTVEAGRRYWRKNLTLIATLLAIWAVVSFGLGILLARPLDGLRIGSLPMGFWWAQQGSMVVFVVLIFVYAWRMDRLDERFHVGEERRKGKGARSRPDEGSR